MVDGVLYWLHLNLSMHFRVGSRTPIIIKMKLNVTTVNNCFQLLPFLPQRRALLRCCMWLELNIVTWSTETLKAIEGISYDLEKTWKTHHPRCPRNIFPEAFCIKLSFLHLISNGFNEVNISLTQNVAFL